MFELVRCVGNLHDVVVFVKRSDYGVLGRGNSIHMFIQGGHYALSRGACLAKQKFQVFDARVRGGDGVYGGFAVRWST